MALPDLIGQVDNFGDLPPRDKIRLFAWWLHAHKGIEHFSNDAIRDCYRSVHLPPDQIAKYLARMVENGDLVKERPGLKLGRAVRTHLDAKYGAHHTVVQVSKLLASLPDQVPSLAEKAFLIEAMKCYRIEAFRACIVMTWNLAFDHLLNWILKDQARLATFNAAIPKRFPKRQGLSIIVQDDFEDMKEFDVIELCGSANLLNKNTVDILRDKLKRRNAAAHPSQIIIVQSQADDMITDLVNNVVLALP